MIHLDSKWTIPGACLALALGVAALAAAQEEPAMTKHATGTFDVKLTALTEDSGFEDSRLGRMSLDKVFDGELEGTSQGQMLTAMTPVEGSAAYVAVEKVAGTVHGRSGSFVLQHSGTMSGGDQRLSITIVPDSGTEELAGIAGTMTIDVREGVHYYDLEYTLPAEP